jgi:hypothetical protein
MKKHIIITFLSLGVLFSALVNNVSGNTNGIFDQLVIKESLAESNVIEYTRLAASDETSYAQELNNLGIKLHPGTDFKPESNGSPRSLNHCKSLVYRTLKSLPEGPVNKLKHLTLYFSDTGHRGLGGGNTVILRCQNVADEELVGVLVHEMGHIMDTGVMKGSYFAGKSEFMDGENPVYRNDKSLGFYRLSFEDENTLRPGIDKYSFVSGYAGSDPWEDFAESFAYYVLHGDEFRKLAENNEILQKKYDYLKNTVFNGKEYYNGYEEKANALVRYYDVTVLPYDINKFFVL